MPSHKMERITEDIHRELTAVFRELKVEYRRQNACQQDIPAVLLPHD